MEIDRDVAPWDMMDRYLPIGRHWGGVAVTGYKMEVDRLRSRSNRTREGLHSPAVLLGVVVVEVVGMVVLVAAECDWIAGHIHFEH